MRNERKQYLMTCFPSVSNEQYEQMYRGKGADNFVVFLTHGRELFARCFHRYYRGNLEERQRYVFSKDGSVRYGSRNGRDWSIKTEFREPVFCISAGYNFDNSYRVINFEAIGKSEMKYCQYEKYCGKNLMEYLHLYCRQPNLEYLMKQGFNPFTEYYCGFWGRCSLRLSDRINWKSNNMLEMLGINRDELKALKGNEHLYETYISWRDEYPKLKPDDVMYIAKTFGNEHGTLSNFVEVTKLSPQRIARYLNENKISNYDYRDYLDQCKTLKYNLKDTAISMPHDFRAMHERLSGIIEYQHNEEVKQAFNSNFDGRKPLEFYFNGLIIRQPHSVEEIANEGAVLHHCVGGYAERHAKGALNIMLIRIGTEPDKPYYTAEISKSGAIIQVRGDHNKDPDEAVSKLISEYKRYLSTIFKDTRRKQAC